MSFPARGAGPECALERAGVSAAHAPSGESTKRGRAARHNNHQRRRRESGVSFRAAAVRLTSESTFSRLTPERDEDAGVRNGDYMALAIVP